MEDKASPAEAQGDRAPQTATPASAADESAEEGDDEEILEERPAPADPRRGAKAAGKTKPAARRRATTKPKQTAPKKRPQKGK